MNDFTHVPDMAAALEEHRQEQVAHVVRLYRNPAFGPVYARRAVKDCIETLHYPFPKLGLDVKAALDA